jgi:hypothetical protein
MWGPPGPRIMHGADAESFQVLRARMEAEWTPQMMQVRGINAASLFDRLGPEASLPQTLRRRDSGDIHCRR